MTVNIIDNLSLELLTDEEQKILCSFFDENLQFSFNSLSRFDWSCIFSKNSGELDSIDINSIVNIFNQKEEAFRAVSPRDFKFSRLVPAVTLKLTSASDLSELQIGMWTFSDIPGDKPSWINWREAIYYNIPSMDFFVYRVLDGYGWTRIFGRTEYVNSILRNSTQCDYSWEKTA